MRIEREKEFEILQRALRDENSHFVAIYGRRRVGKTFLVRETFWISIHISACGII